MTALPGARETAAALLALGASRSTADSRTSASASASGEAVGDPPHPGYYASVTHARAFVAVGSGTFQKQRGCVGNLLVARA